MLHKPSTCISHVIAHKTARAQLCRFFRCPSPCSSASPRFSTEETITARCTWAQIPKMGAAFNLRTLGPWSHPSRARAGSTSPTRSADRSLPTSRCARPPPALPVFALLTPPHPAPKISLVCGMHCLLESTPLCPSPQSWRPWPHRVSSSPFLGIWLSLCRVAPICAAFPLARVPATNR